VLMLARVDVIKYAIGMQGFVTILGAGDVGCARFQRNHGSNERSLQ